MRAGPPPEFWIGLLVCVGVILAIAIAINILFLLTLYRTQSQVADRNRELQPGTVWWTLLINFVPIVGAIWCAYMVNKLSASLKREYEDRGWRTGGEGFARTAGLVWAWGGLVSLAVSVLQNVAQMSGAMEVAMVISILNLPIGIGLLVAWIMYWVQMAQYGKRLREGGREYEPGSTEEHYDDRYRGPVADDEDFDRPRRPRHEEDDDLDDRARAPAAGRCLTCLGAAGCPAGRPTVAGVDHPRGRPATLREPPADSFADRIRD
jgi:hypothetical protein